MVNYGKLYNGISNMRSYELVQDSFFSVSFMRALRLEQLKVFARFKCALLYFFFISKSYNLKACYYNACEKKQIKNTSKDIPPFVVLVKKNAKNLSD